MCSIVGVLRRRDKYDKFTYKHDAQTFIHPDFSLQISKFIEGQKQAERLMNVQWHWCGMEGTLVTYYQQRLQVGNGHIIPAKIRGIGCITSRD